MCRISREPRLCILPCAIHNKLRAASRESSYNRLMSLAVFGMHVLVVLFFIGLIGSSVVVLISFLEDAKELVGDEDAH